MRISRFASLLGGLLLLFYLLPVSGAGKELGQRLAHREGRDPLQNVSIPSAEPSRMPVLAVETPQPVSLLTEPEALTEEPEPFPSPFGLEQRENIRETSIPGGLSIKNQTGYEIQVTELQVTYSIEDENGAWWLISADGRAVEQVTLDKALGYTRVEGLAIRTPQPGAVVQALPGQIIDPDEGTAVEQDQADADEQLSALIGVMTALEKNRIIGEIALIDVTDATNLRLEYPQLLTVRLGGAERMDYKISYLAAAVEELADTQSGELDLSLEYTEDAVFTPAR